MERLVFPTALFPPNRDVALWLAGNKRSQGRTAGGLNPTVSSGGPGWWCYEQAIFLHEPSQQATWQALEAITDGGAVPLIVPVRWAIDQFIPYGAGVSEPEPVPFSDGTFFDDGTGFAGGAISAEFSAPAEMNATTVSIRMLGGHRALVGNEHFTVLHSIAEARVYRIGQILSVDGDVYTVRIRAWLRQAVVEGEEVDFNNPRMLANVIGADAFKMPLDSNRHSNVSVRFEEYFDEYDFG